MSADDEWVAHEDCKALHMFPQPYTLNFFGRDGLTGYVLGQGRTPVAGIDGMEFIERQVLAATCRAIVREVERVDAEVQA